MRIAERSTALFLFLILMFYSVAAQEPAANQADLQKEAATAQSLYDEQNFIGALPLYEDLHNRVPQSNVYRERLAMALIGSGGGKSSAEQQAIADRARKLLLEAQAAGDNSNGLQIMLEKLGPAGSTMSQRPPSPGAEAFGKAEKEFSSGDLAGAVKLYEEAFAADPKLYEAPLYAGDSEYKLGHYAEANAWYAKAVAVDPDRETAYRYWGDCLMKMGDSGTARDKFIEGIVAQPYQRTPRIGLKQWADANHMRLFAPPITLPARATPNASGGANISVDPSMLGTQMASANLAYEMGSTVWRNGMFQKTYPNEKQYRHSLGEEAQSIRVALSSVSKVPPDKWDPTWKALAQLDKEGMLECWILLDHPDQGIAQDYVAFRAAHRDLLRQYIAKYDLHPA